MLVEASARDVYVSFSLALVLRLPSLSTPGLRAPVVLRLLAVHQDACLLLARRSHRPLYPRDLDGPSVRNWVMFRLHRSQRIVELDAARRVSVFESCT